MIIRMISNDLYYYVPNFPYLFQTLLFADAGISNIHNINE
jgi:hypothetical protein